jgi:hypothetical protein
MTWMVTDAELLSNELCYTPTSPHSTAKAECLSTLSQQVHQVRELNWVKQGSRPGGRMGTQRIHTSSCGAFEPLADCTLRDTQGLCYVLLRPSHLMQLPGTQAATFVPTNGLFGICCCAHKLKQSKSRSIIITSLCADQ